MKFKAKKLFKIALLSAALVQMQALHAEAIIVGEENDVGYAAIVSSDGVAIRVTGDTPESGRIENAAMNSLGNSLVVGNEDGGIPYIAFVSLDGVATRITEGTPTVPSFLGAVGINESGAGIITGQQSSPGVYAALISPEGVITEVFGAGAPTGTGSIAAAAINDSGWGIIGGNHVGANTTYAGVVAPNGEATAVTGGGFNTAAGFIFSVDINNSGLGIIGGQNGGGVSPMYAALVDTGGNATQLTGDYVPVGAGRIASVAINDSGNALVGGRNNANSVVYAARVDSSGTATFLTGSPPQGDGIIEAVAINEAGMGIIAGDHNGGDLYAALVSPSGAAQLITGDVPPAGGSYDFAAISESGVGLLGATDPADTFFAALVSPSGISTLISGEIPEGEVNIFGGDITDILRFVDPISYGPANAFADPIVALSSNVLTNHLRRAPEREPDTQTAALTADASDRIRQPQGQGCERANYAVWGAPFGLFATYDKGHSFPKLQEWSTGGIVGFDYLGWDNIVLGGGAAYSFQHVDYKSQGGHAEIHQELLTVYAAWQGNHISIDGALWGGIYQMHNKRKTLGSINSTSNVDGGIFAPHLRVGAPFKINNTVLTVEPFAMFDWINNWQGSVKEKGSAGLNIRMDSHYVSLLRSEVGLNLRQYLHYSHGDFTFEESGSYVNRAAFNAKKKDAYYVGSVSTFSVQLFSDRVENLGALRLSGRYVPCNIVYPYVSLTYLGEFGADLMVNTFALEVGKRF